jgi:hypothetical protein
MKRTSRSMKAHSVRDGSPVPRELVKATTAPDIVNLPPRCCLAIDGAGSPQDPAFAQAIGALYGTAYALKFARKRAGAKGDFKVGPLEGHWSADVPPGATGRPTPDTWRWRLRIGVPAGVTKDEIDRVKRDVVANKGGKLAGSAVVPRVFLESIPGQRAGRILHVGRYADEQASFALIAPVLERAGLTAAPTHIEVYLSDPSRTRPDALRTVLLCEVAAAPKARQPRV